METNGKDEDLEEMRKKVEQHCPVYGMLTSSGVKIRSQWTNIYVDF